VIKKIFRPFTATAKWIRKILTSRGVMANLLMICFILLSAAGAALIYAPAGFIVAGVACGVFGFLLGLE
jgi:hypothetical protein